MIVGRGKVQRLGEGVWLLIADSCIESIMMEVSPKEAKREFAGNGEKTPDFGGYRGD